MKPRDYTIPALVARSDYFATTRDAAATRLRDTRAASRLFDTVSVLVGFVERWPLWHFR